MSAVTHLPNATIRRSVEDFVVDEIPAYAPSGAGEHVFVTFRKTGLTTPDAVRCLADALASDPRATGYAGMKDRHAVTTQTASFQVPLAVDPAPRLEAARIQGIEVLKVERHGHKLKPGHLQGNRFRIVLRDLDPAAVAGLIADLEAIGRAGVPNAFGPQRFGRDGSNPERAAAWLSGKSRGPRDKREQRLLFSALQSLWFNQVLARREEDGTWNVILPGDLAKKKDTGGVFLVPLDGPEAAAAVERGKAGEIGPTGPMFGKKMRWPEGSVGALEREVLCAAIGDPARLDAWGHLGEGTRRPLRMEVEELSCELLTDQTLGAPDRLRRPPPQTPPAADGRAALAVRFVLPKGGYATTVLGRAAHLTDATIARSGREQTSEAERLAQDSSEPQDEDAQNG